MVAGRKARGCDSEHVSQSESNLDQLSQTEQHTAVSHVSCDLASHIQKSAMLDDVHREQCDGNFDGGPDEPWVPGFKAIYRSTSRVVPVVEGLYIGW